MKKTTAQKIYSKEENREYLVWADNSPITEEELENEFYLLMTNNGQVNVHHKTDDFIIYDIVFEPKTIRIAETYPIAGQTKYMGAITTDGDHVTIYYNNGYSPELGMPVEFKNNKYNTAIIGDSCIYSVV